MRSTGFRRTVLALGVCSSLVLAATACGSGDGGAASGRTRITVNCEPPRSAKVDRAFFEEDVAAFEEAHPGTSTSSRTTPSPAGTRKTFDAKLAGGQMEDVFYTYSRTRGTWSTSARPPTSPRT
ncbi:hypothetical protein LT493_16875 [Streptomyces tricolor]|nr:hypothetical protein [Streptomyces tricolor]